MKRKDAPPTKEPIKFHGTHKIIIIINNNITHEMIT